LVRRGELPTIAQLMAEGSYGVLHSLASRRSGRGALGYWSPVVWTSIATGVGPERHGVDDFYVTRPGGRRGLAATTDRRAAAFWNLFPAFGQRVAVVGWWASWPAEPIDGYVASSHLGLRGFKRGGRYRGQVGPPRLDLPGLTHPPELAAEITPLYPPIDEAIESFEERVYRLSAFPLDLGRKGDVLYAVAWQDRYYLEIARWLMRREVLPLQAVYFEGVDSTSHHFWHYRDHPEALPEHRRRTFPVGFDDHRKAVDNYYKVIDGYLADLLEELPEDGTVVVVSDHGFGPDPDRPEAATHSPYGVLLARGPGIARGRALNLSLAGSAREAAGGRTGVLDLLPTLLYLHGLPVADDLEGEPIWRLFTREHLAAHPLRRVPSYGRFTPGAELAIETDAESDEEYERRLRGLGYLD
jgi:predicted AlkP superfamily phosphohydrolase/phosphomutase